MGHRSDLPSSWGYSSKGTEFSFFDCRRDLPPTRRFNSGWGPGALDKIIFAARGSTVLNSLEGKGSPRVLFETWESRGRVGDFRSKWVAAHMPVCCDWSSRFRLLPTRVTALYFNVSAAGAAGAVVAGAGFRYLSHHASQRS
jgi:hypothetical protein